MGQKSKPLRVINIEWEENGHRSPLWDRFMRLLFREPLTIPEDSPMMLGEASCGAGAIEKEDEDA